MKTKLKAFLEKQNVKPSLKLYFIDAMSAMAMGLFASLLIGTILGVFGKIWPQLTFFTQISSYAGVVSGAAMAVAIAYALKAPPLVLYSMLIVGYAANMLGGAGGPLAVFLLAIPTVEIGKLVSKTTKVDILVTPAVTVLAGCGLATLIAPLIKILAGYVTTFIDFSMKQQPLVMGVLVSVVIGVALTLPISSAAICAALQLSGAMVLNAAGDIVSAGGEGLALAGGAAVAGCCAQMVGFAVMSYRDNKAGGLVSVGVGTSMLLMPNIIRNPRIWIPPTLVSAITGTLATCVFGMKMYGAAINSGMGPCGFLGPIGIILGWFGGEYPATVTTLDWVGLGLICFVIPAVGCLLLDLLFRKLGWIKEGDLKLGA